MYGTNLVAVQGTYDDVNGSARLSGDREWAFVNVNLRPYYSQGSKTIAFEIAEQLGFELPQHVVVPIASGSLFRKSRAGSRSGSTWAPGRDRCPPSTALRRTAARPWRAFDEGRTSAGR